MDEEFHNTSTILSAFVVSVYVLGYAVSICSIHDITIALLIHPRLVLCCSRR